MSSLGRVLLAEDSATQAMQIQMLLEQAGFEVTVAKDGRAALQAVHAETPDIVVTDLQMPEMNGLELVEAMQKQYREVPVVLITAHGSEDIAAEALRKGAASYVPKREMNSDLLPTLKRILAVVNARHASERLSAIISAAETEFLLDNDSSLTPFLIARLQDDLSQLGVCDEGELVQVATALDEALVNAIVHGNLEVPSELRLVDDGKAYSLLIEERKNQPPYKDRRVVVKVSASREKAVIAIRDEGPGFDLSEIPDRLDPTNLDKISGRGLLLINAFMDEVSHNEQGNEIVMVKRKRRAAAE